MNDRLFVDVHVLQTVPPSNLNRDDTGSPKSARYGGAMRSRVSSQAWKRATRKYCELLLPREAMGQRTKKLDTMLADEIQRQTGCDAELATRLSKALLARAELLNDKGESRDYLIFVGHREMERAAAIVADRLEELAEMDDSQLKAAVEQLDVRACFSGPKSVDVALFGRMIADIPSLNVDAACQVAHAISTHAVEPEFDYFTAVDDRNPKEETGAGMIGTIEFNAATLYRYATVCVHDLVDSLGDPEAAVQGTSAFIEGFVRSLPTGKQTTFAHNTVPDAVVVAVRRDQPISLVAAFEQPVSSRDGYVRASARALAEHWDYVQASWAAEPVAVAGTYAPGIADEIAAMAGPSQSVDALLESVSTAIGDGQP